MADELYGKVNYLVDIPLLINANIIEYDISKANITMMLSYGLISLEEYNRFANMDKITREVSIGRRIKNDTGALTNDGIKIDKCIAKGIMESKRLLFESNHIPQEAIVRIANDAVFVNNHILQYTSFDLNNNGVLVTFKQKNQFNIMINLGLVTIFINDNPMNDSIEVDVKGINDSQLYKHQLFLEFVCNLLSNMQRSGKETAIYLFSDFYSKYLNKELSVEYYREFNADSMYKFKLKPNYYLDFVSEKDKDTVDIEYNLSILRKIYSAIIDR